MIAIGTGFILNLEVPYRQDTTIFPKNQFFLDKHQTMWYT